MNILVGSKSEVKLTAVRESFSGPIRVYVDGRSSRSLVNEQPMGLEEIWQGARNRLDQILQVAGYTYYIVIENGLLYDGCVYLDMALVIMQNNAGLRYHATSAGVPMPFDCVIEAQRRGFLTTTAGMIVAEKYGGDDADPHFTLTHGRVSRKDMLKQAIEICYGQFSRSILK